MVERCGRRGPVVDLWATQPVLTFVWVYFGLVFYNTETTGLYLKVGTTLGKTYNKVDEAKSFFMGKLLLGQVLEFQLLFLDSSVFRAS